MKIGSFCSGVAGLDLGTAAALRALGGEVEHAWFAEDAEGASAVLAERFPGVPNHRDLIAFDWSAAEPVDVLTMGFPCQPFSAAGLRRGTDDERHLFPHIVTAIEKMPQRPSMIVIENVPNLVTIQGGEVWRYVRDELVRLGYAGVWRIAPAAAVGAPHLRKRVVLVAVLRPGREAVAQSSVRYSKTGVPLLKTPTAQLVVNGGSQHPDKRRAGGHGPTLADEIEHLLPTPTAARYGYNQGGANPDGPKRYGLDSIEHLLPTPRASDSRGVGVRAIEGRKTTGYDLQEALALLPTPTGSNSHGNKVNNRGELLLPGAVTAEVFGKYAPAVDRWAAIVGPPPPPRETGRTGERLSPAFVEWMVGLPPGFVTGVPLTRASALRCLGNIVVPQFAAVIVRELLAELSALLTAGDDGPGAGAIPRQRTPLSRPAKVSAG